MFTTWQSAGTMSSCGYCNSTQAPFYRLRDRREKSTEIGKVVEVILEEEVKTDFVCRKCNRQLLRLQELQKQFEELRTELVQNSLPVQPTNTRLRSPSTQRTGASPAEKRARPSRAASAIRSAG